MKNRVKVNTEVYTTPPRLKVLPLTQKYQTEQKDFDSKMCRIDASMCIVPK